MSSMKILTVALLPLIVAGCTSQQKSVPAAATQKTSTASAVHVAGDLTPTRLVSLKVPRPTEPALLQGSDPLAPLKGFDPATPAEPVIGRDVHKVMKGDPSTFLLPVDAPLGARVIVRPIDPTVNLTTVHLVSAATGAQLDLARDDGTMGINVAHGGAPTTAPAGAPQDGRNTPIPMASGPLAREPGFEPLALQSRLLSFDVPFQPGMVRVVVPPAVAASGIVVELQQPNSHVTFSGVPDDLGHGFGDTVTVTCGLLSDTAPIDGATVTGWVELPGHVQGPSLTFTAAGGGQYVASLPLNSSDQSMIGAWGLHLQATGTQNGVPFEKEIEHGFGYWPAHAQMTALGAPVVVRGADGLVDSVSFDVDVHTLVDDRFSVRGTLTYTDAQGAEHPLASAQTGQVIAAGDGTITLRFDASALALAKVSGPFNLRDVALVSQGVGITEHRIGRGLEIATPLIAANELRYPKQIPFSAQDMMDNGDLPKP